MLEHFSAGTVVAVRESEKRMTMQDMYLIRLDYSFIRNAGMCIIDESTMETGQLHPLCCEDIHSKSLSLFFFFYICRNEHCS